MMVSNMVYIIAHGNRTGNVKNIKINSMKVGTFMTRTELLGVEMAQRKINK